MKNYLFTSSRFLVALLFLPLLATTPACAAIAGDDEDDQAPEQNIVEIAVSNDFTTLVAALQAADLVSTLEGEGPITVFAPTDAAFAALPEGTVEDLL
ncbi:MAG: fasciclin domain-containing protein, partial [Rhodothermales bacterium]